MGNQPSSQGKHESGLAVLEACVPQFQGLAAPDRITPAVADPVALDMLCGMCEANDDGGIERICNEGRGKIYINSISGQPERQGLAPMHLAALRGSVAAFVALIRCGASIDLPSQDGHRVEYYAMLNRHRPMLKAISETRVALQTINQANASNAVRRTINVVQSADSVPQQGILKNSGGGTTTLHHVVGRGAPTSPAASEPVQQLFAGFAALTGMTSPAGGDEAKGRGRPVQFEEGNADWQRQQQKTQERVQRQVDQLRNQKVERELLAQREQFSAQMLHPHPHLPPPHQVPAQGRPQSQQGPPTDSRAWSVPLQTRAAAKPPSEAGSGPRRLFGAGSETASVNKENFLAHVPPAHVQSSHVQSSHVQSQSAHVHAGHVHQDEEDVHSRCFPMNPFRRGVSVSSPSPASSRSAFFPPAGRVLSPSVSVPAHAAPQTHSSPPGAGALRAQQGIRYGQPVRSPKEVAGTPELQRMDDSQLQRQLVKCCASDDAQGFERLVRNQQAGRLLNSLDYNGVAPIHVAAHRGSQRVLRLLIASRVRLDLESDEGYTPEDYAGRNHQWDAFNTLREAHLKQKERQLKPPRPVLVGAFTPSARTPVGPSINAALMASFVGAPPGGPAGLGGGGAARGGRPVASEPDVGMFSLGAGLAQVLEQGGRATFNVTLPAQARGGSVAGSVTSSMGVTPARSPQRTGAGLSRQGSTLSQKSAAGGEQASWRVALLEPGATTAPSRAAAVLSRKDSTLSQKSVASSTGRRTANVEFARVKQSRPNPDQIIPRGGR